MSEKKRERERERERERGTERNRERKKEREGGEIKTGRDGDIDGVTKKQWRTIKPVDY